MCSERLTSGGKQLPPLPHQAQPTDHRWSKPFSQMPPIILDYARAQLACKFSTIHTMLCYHAL